MTYNNAMKKLLALSMVLVGCGAPDPTPTEQCSDLIDAMCAKQRICTSYPYSQCVPEVRAVLPCGNAVGVGSLYDKCIGDLEGKVCAELFPDGTFVLPNDCTAVIKF